MNGFLSGSRLIFHDTCRLNPAKAALLVIDMQYNDAHPDFGFSLAVEKTAPGSMGYSNRRLEKVTVPTIKSLIEFFRSKNMKIVYVTTGSDDPDYRDWRPIYRGWQLRLEAASGVHQMWWSGSPLFRIRDELKPIEGELVVNKKTAGAFNDDSTNLGEELKKKDVDCLVVTGVATSWCVETTARDATDRGFTCVLVDEGTCDYDENIHKASLRAFQTIFGDVLTNAQEVIEALSRQDSN